MSEKSDLKKLVSSKNILEELLSYTDERLCSYFKELSKLNFHLSGHGMKSKHKFTVFEHTKKLLKNFALALRYREDKEFCEKDLLNTTVYKRYFFKRVIGLMEELELKTDSDDFRVIVLTMLLHDVGKCSYDMSEEAIIEQSNASKKSLKYRSVEYLKLYYRNKDHDERGAFLAYSRFEEGGIDQIFAARVRNTIIGHDDFGTLHRDKDFNFFTFLRRIMNHATIYNYPMLGRADADKILIRELNINYLVYLMDVFSVDDTGEIWYSIRSDKETIYMKGKWLLGRKLKDILDVVDIEFRDKWELEKKRALENRLRKSFLQGLRGTTKSLLDTEFDGIISAREKGNLINFLNSYFSLTDNMYPFYLNDTSPEDKIRHMKLFGERGSDFNFTYVIDEKDPSTFEIHIVKQSAYEGTLLRIVRAIMVTSIERDRCLKIYKLYAYSGQNNRLIDIVTVKHIDNVAVKKELFELLSYNLSKCTEAGYTKEQLDLPISKEDFDSRTASLGIDLNNIEIDTRTFQEIRVRTKVISNLNIYCCLEVLSYINIVNVKVEEEYGGYVYVIVISQLNNKTYKITSASAFKADLIAELSRNVKLC